MNHITIVAESGINHDGNPQIAIEAVYKAKEAGADAVKFQLFTERARPRGKKFIFAPEVWMGIAGHARKIGIEIFWSVFGFEDVDLAKVLGAKWVKLSIVERRNLELIERCELAGFDRKFVSVDLYGQYPKRQGWEYLYCPNNGWSGFYPTKDEHVEWERYAEIAGKAGMGYSCHATNMNHCLIAAALGARIIEKHFAVNPNGPDADVSLNVKDFAKMVKVIRAMEARTVEPPMMSAMPLFVDGKGLSKEDKIEIAKQLHKIREENPGRLEVCRQ